MSAAAWLGLPLLFHLLASGLGMTAERLARFPLANALLAPAGACLAVLVSLPVVQLHRSATVSAVLIVALAVLGLALNRRRLAERLFPGWPALAGLTALALYLAPVVLSGHWTWLGYNFVNDTAIHFSLVDHVAEHGAAMATGPPSTHDAAIDGALSSGYPLGVYGLLAALGRLIPVETAALYQPFIACLAGLAAMALARLARQVGTNGPVAAAIGLVAAGAGLTYQYAAHGAIKELALVLVLAVVAALAREALDGRLHPGAVALTAACSATGIAVFSAAAGAYTVGLVLVGVAAIVAERLRVPMTTIARATAVGTLAIVVSLLPVAADTLDFGHVASGAFSAGPGGLITPTVFGHLVRPLPVYQSLGIWFRDDYRYPLEPGLPQIATTDLLMLAGALVAIAVVAEVRGRRFGALLALLPALLVYLFAAPRLSPYADAKLLVALSPMVVFTAAIGAWWLSRRHLAVGVVTGVLVCGGVLISDALAYHHARLAPVDRLEALREAAERTHGDLPWLLPEWEELAKYFAGDLALNVGPEAYSPQPVVLRKPEPIFARSFDLDQLTLSYVERWPGLMLRRSPVASAPPANYAPGYRNAYYELWYRRTTPRVLEHLPLPAGGEGTGRPRCEQVRAMARRAGPGERLVAIARPALVTFDPSRPSARPRSWGPGASRGLVIPVSRAQAQGRVTVPGDDYRVWVRGGGGRAAGVRIDGREVGRKQQVNTPGQWLRLGRAHLAAGAHAIALFVPGGSLRPGDGFPGELGRVALEPERPPTRVSVPPRRAGELCGRSWDWIERVTD